MESNGQKPDRATLRSGILNAGKDGKKQQINILGYEVEVRQPTVGQVLEMQSSGDQTEIMLTMMVNQTYVPGTDQPVFDDTDKAELRKLPADKWIGEFNDAILELTSLNTEDAEKN